MDTNEKKPNVFISWSGARSKHAAAALREWLPNVIQAATPWMSDRDLESGAVSLEEMATVLQSTQTGILCLTPENLSAEWINFEAGALMKTLNSKARVCTYLLADLESGSLKGPLSMFQAAKANEEKTRKLVMDINEHLGQPLAESTLANVFAKWWPDLKQKLDNLPPPRETPPPSRDPADIAAEILEHVRSIRPQIEQMAKDTARSRAHRLWSEIDSTMQLAELTGRPEMPAASGPVSVSLLERVLTQEFAKRALDSTAEKLKEKKEDKPKK